MKRSITKRLLSWKNQENRKPLIIRGARQVGKSYSVIDFGKNHFEGTVHIIDLEQHPDWHHIFKTNLDALRIVSELEILLNTRISAGKDLLFFDEIQAFPRAVTALRYFYEQIPDLHVIAAGSLLEFTMKNISFPVGRVQILNMFPMSFPEYLYALDKSKAAELISEAPKKQPEAIHAMLLNELHRYLFIGGMPECVQTFINTGKLHDVFDVQGSIVNTYRQDFSKYAPYSDKRCLNAVLTSIATNAGQQIKYSRLAEGFSNPTIKKAFDLLCLAQVIHKIRSASPAGLPLEATASERKFKAIMVDIGLMRYISGMPANLEYSKSHLLSIFQGALAEQFVGQEFAAAGQTDLYYWSREAKSSTAEVDYLLTKDNRIIPVEVKSGPSGRLKSLHRLLQTYPGCKEGYVFSNTHYSKLPEQKLIFLPLYFAYTMALK